MQKFSVIIPTYTGAQTIKQTLDSLLKQDGSKISYEVVTVIDGPNKELRKLLDTEGKRFNKRNINFSIKQFDKNKGRFEARIAGAKLAKTDQLLFVDDKVQFAEGFLGRLGRIRKSVVMPNVIELTSKNIISQTLTMLRRRIYGQRYGLSFKDYYIDEANFESSPKGTTCLWIDKTTFLAACEAVRKGRSGHSKFVSDDTRLLHQVVTQGGKIFRTAKMNVYYQPRNDFGAALKHLYGRGPLFVDYYSKPSTKYFPLLIFIYLLTLSVILWAIIIPKTFIWLLAGLTVSAIVVGFFISHSWKEFVIAIAGLPLIGIVFTAGVLKGTAVMAKGLFVSR